MKVFRILGRNIRDSFKSVFRNFSLSLASISCITITLIVVALSIVLSFNVSNFTKEIEKDVTIVAFLDNSITDQQKEDIKDQIASLNHVDTIKYEDKMNISNEMMESSDVFKSIMKNWSRTESPIMNTYKVKVDDIHYIDQVAKEIKAITGVNTVKYGEGMVDQLIAVFTAINKFSIGLVVALIIVTAFLIGNTIKITIFSRKREIEIMRLVGASNLNIKIPFVFEGLFLGLFGSIIPIIITIYGYINLYRHFNGQMFSPFIKLIEPEPFIYLISLILAGIGILVGMFGSWRAVRKHLKI